ncbi:cytochrome c oxidase assembly factor Coa1 family protein [Flavobacterium sp. ABG]|uniref:cytochrome c oxidase assembly factor Coa1 family protein n=1 Tax=Flavobacterium sp. ABG TaxID=1423322 RepID=UPI000649A0FC|nr:cytochrome c oxidase assembly factor Coa1 family protein [Flavobacterium sp. ABG]KLT69603.1 hypothetical protein AB674_11700 [Flavobacterium sp. ABG]
MEKTENELVLRKSWWSRNWKWFLPLTLLSILSFGFILSSNIAGNTTDIVQAYSDNSLFEDAIQKANTNQEVLKIIGTIAPLDQLAILEGNTSYSKDHSTVHSSVRIQGTKTKGKLDITAFKKGTGWAYTKIVVRIKNSKKEIKILD